MRFFSVLACLAASIMSSTHLAFCGSSSLVYFFQDGPARPTSLLPPPCREGEDAESPASAVEGREPDLVDSEVGVPSLALAVLGGVGVTTADSLLWTANEGGSGQACIMVIEDRRWLRRLDGRSAELPGRLRARGIRIFEAALAFAFATPLTSKRPSLTALLP